MQELYAKYKNIILGGGIFLVAVIGYFIFFSGNETQQTTPVGGVQTVPTSGVPVTDGATNVDQAQLAAELASLNTIQFDSSLFDSPIFQSLTDFSKPLGEESVGRPNPFAPADMGKRAVVGTSTPSTP